MKDIQDKLLVEMYRNTKSESTRREVKKELLTRGYRFVVKEQWNPGWQAWAAGGAVAFILLVGIVTYGFKHRSTVEVAAATQPNNTTEFLVLQSEIAALRTEVVSLTEKNRELSAQCNVTNERLWRFGVMNQENWCRFNSGEKKMVLMTDQWYPDQQLQHLPASVTQRLQLKAATQETMNFMIPQPIIKVE